MRSATDDTKKAKVVEEKMVALKELLVVEERIKIALIEANRDLWVSEGRVKATEERATKPKAEAARVTEAWQEEVIKLNKEL